MNEEIWLNFRFNQDKAVRLILENLSLNYKYVKSGSTRYENDSSDYDSWVLHYAINAKSLIDSDKRKLEQIKIFNQPIFMVNGNGYGTAISLMMKNIIFTPKDIVESIKL